MLLKDTDERKVNLVVSQSKTLGISIRGGNEFGLGIYITQVDYGSPAENAGLKVGDQILDVNGRTFLDISHGDAVKVLKSSRHLMITVKDVGKLPYARTTYDHTEWIPGEELDGNKHKVKYTDYGSLRSDTISLSGRLATSQPNDSMFSRGAGSQLMHNAMMSHRTQMALIEESARHLLPESQRTALKYYLEEYQKEFIEVEALLLALFEILTTKTKFALLTEIRGIILPKDLKIFDHLVLQKEVMLLKSKSMETLFPLPQDTDDESVDFSHSHYGWPSVTSDQHTTQASEEEMQALRQAIELMECDRIQESKNNKKSHRIKLPFGSLKGKKKRRAPPIPDTKVEAEIHKSPDRGRKKDNKRSPSEDSGVELNGSAKTSQNVSMTDNSQSGTRKQRSDLLFNSDNGYHGKYMSLGRKNAYSLIDTAIHDSVDKDAMLSSLSDMEDSVHDRMNLFKTLPAQFESEMVHANIQTEEDWSHVPGGLGSHGRRRKPVTGHKSGMYSARSENDLLTLNSLMTHQNGDAEAYYANVSKPLKPPRSHKSTTKIHNEEETDHEVSVCTMSSSIPNINLDEPYSAECLNSQDEDHRFIEPLSIIPPPPSSDEQVTSAAPLNTNQYKLYDIPFDDAYISYTAAPPSQTRLDLSPIAIVPPPPPMESSFGIDGPDANSSDHKTSKEGNEQVSLSETKSSSVDDRDLQYVVVNKTRPTLGLAIEGGANTRQPLPRIINIQPDGAAALCINLCIGDVIAEVNGQSLDGRLHRECAKTIATAFKDKQTDSLVLGVIKCSRKMKL